MPAPDNSAVNLPVIVVGGGFSGTLLAVHLARLGQSVVLIERHEDALAKGLAYGTRHSEHVLNVRASNMSAFPDDAGHFLRWMGFSSEDQANRFVPRLAYGQYLHDVLLRSLAEAGSRFAVVCAEAVDWREEAGRVVVRLTDGQEQAGRALVLALGNLPPRLPAPLAGLPQGLAHADPWNDAAIADLDPDAPVLLLGTGLTALDVALSLANAGHRGPMLALSRRGLRPRSHALTGPVVKPVACPPERGVALLRAVRQRAGAVGWRTAIDELRPHTRRLWQDHDERAQGRFLRHLRPFWDVHRHRLAPPVAARVDALVASGQLTFRAGRLLGASLEAGRAVLDWRPRGSDAQACFVAARVINCTGPEGDIARCGERLLRRLLADGAARADCHRLGLEVDADCRLRPAGGKTAAPLYAVGPLTKGASWEIIAVPDIRHQVWDLARRLAS